MVTFLVYATAALYLGVLTSISPCPLATNIAAISYIGRKVDKPRLVINAGLLYTLGRCLLYIALAGLLTTMALSIPSASRFLQKYAGMVLGPIFLLLGMFLVGLITISAGGTLMSERMQKRVDAMGIWAPCCWASSLPFRSAPLRRPGSSDCWRLRWVPSPVPSPSSSKR